MAWTVSADREHRYKMPEVCTSKLRMTRIGDMEDADMFRNSLTGSHLRDTGPGNSKSTRRRRGRLAARDPHKESKDVRKRCENQAFMEYSA